MRTHAAKPAAAAKAAGPAPARKDAVRPPTWSDGAFAHDFSSIPTHTRTELRPHDAPLDQLRAEAQIYAQGKTPLRMGGQVSAWDAAPLGAAETGNQLQQIERQFGPRGVQRSVHGLGVTRGAAFAQSAALHAGLSPAARTPQGGPIGRQAAGAIRANSASERLPQDVRGKLEQTSGQELGDIAIHNDERAHQAAETLGARAFTVGQSIYFARGQYQPGSREGLHLLAHEAAHTAQQGGQGAQPTEHFSTSASSDGDELEAVHFADAVAQGKAAPLPSASHGAGVIHRAISFTHANDSITTNNIGATVIGGTGFRLSSAPHQTFVWKSDVTIHGVAGDPFANFQCGFLQVEREFYVNVHWGTGANHTHRAVRPDAALPRRDAASAGSIFASDSEPYRRPAFAADGDVRKPEFSDTPGTAVIPFTNPHATRTGNSGWFNYGDAFVTYLSARNTVSGAWRHLANVYWNMSLQGSFDGSRPAGSRIVLTAPGPVNHSPVLEGASGEFPAMHGGTIANGHDTTTDT